MPSLLRLCLLEPELRWHFIYINNYWPESPPGLPPSNQTSNALKIAQHLLLIGNYKMHCYSCSLPLLIVMEIMSIINRLNRLHVLIQRCVSFVNRFESFFFCSYKNKLKCVLRWEAQSSPAYWSEWTCVAMTSAINCFWANPVCSLRTPSVAGLYKRRIKDASRIKKKARVEKGSDPLNICAPSLHCANRGYCCPTTPTRQSPTWGEKRAEGEGSFPRPRTSVVVKLEPVLNWGSH